MTIIGHPVLARSVTEDEVAARRRRYQETILRQLHVTHPGYEAEVGWGEAEKAPYVGLLSQMRYSTCDVLRYRHPPAVPEDLSEHPVAPPASDDDSVFRGIARLDLAVADPARQRELFGWTTPRPDDEAGVASFEGAKADYWARVCRHSLDHLELLKETADFHAVKLLRLLYLAGDTPAHLRAERPLWRAPDALGRRVDFSAGVEGHIVEALLGFKYWVDDPFFVDGHLHPGDAERIKARRRAAVETKDFDGGEVDHEMTFWSENHQILFASAEYLAGQWLPDEVFRAGLAYRGEGSHGTRPGDLTGHQRMGHARRRVLGWLDERLRLGFSEWNAPGYYEEDVAPLCNLVDFCLDEDVRVRAEMVLDLLLFDLARFSIGGSFGVSAGRCYFEQKCCGLDQPVGDLVEVLFGTRGGVIVGGDSMGAGSLASSPRYAVPDVLVKIGQDRPARMVDRSRVSVGFEEASTYGVGFDTLDDAMFWWSRGAYFAKQVIDCTQRVGERYRLSTSPPFKKILPAFETLDAAIGWGKGLLYAATGPALWPVLGPLLGNPWGDHDSEIADLLSLMTEGSALTRANLYTYKDRHTMLSSVQNWRAGQFNFQTQVCQATLGPGATVWTGHPSAGAYLDVDDEAEAGGGLFGSIVGSTLGAIAFGPIGAIAGGIYGGVKGAEAGDDAFDGPIELFPADNHDGPNWWTGSVTLPRVVQREGAAILAYDPHDIPATFFGSRTHAWFPRAAFDEGSVVQGQPANGNAERGMWTFGRVGDGYVALFSARPVTWTTKGAWAHKELLAEGGRNVFIIQVGSKDGFGSYERFVSRVSRARIHLNGLRWSPGDFMCSYDIPSPGGSRLELHYDEGKVHYRGRPFSDDAFPRFEGPYVKCGRVRWGQYHYTLSFGGHSLTHDFRELRTKVVGARVGRWTDEAERDCAEDRTWVVSHRGSGPSPPNTVEACSHAVEVEGADGLWVDACLTADGQVVLWPRWDPDSLAALLGLADDGGAFRLVGPDAGDALRRPTVELTLAQLRSAYGWVEAASPPDAPAVPVVIPTLAELVEVARGWAGLRHLLVHVQVPPDGAEAHAGVLLGRVVAALAADVAFDVTVLSPYEEVVTAMVASGHAAHGPVPIALVRHRRVPPPAPPEDGSRPPHPPRPVSGFEAAVADRATMASLGRPSSGPAVVWDTFDEAVARDLAAMEAYNLNPRVNQGHQVERLLASVIDAPWEMEVLVEMGVSGIVTNDAPAVRRALGEVRRRQD